MPTGRMRIGGRNGDVVLAGVSPASGIVTFPARESGGDRRWIDDLAVLVQQADLNRGFVAGEVNDDVIEPSRPWAGGVRRRRRRRRRQIQAGFGARPADEGAEIGRHVDAVINLEVIRAPSRG